MKDITGKKYNYLTAIKTVGKNKENRFLWECLCDCGNSIVTTKNQLDYGNRKSCGCKNNADKIKHGMRNHDLYSTWSNMIRRCTVKSDRSFPDYGGRGITVCSEWMDINSFIRDMGERPSKNHSIDRIDNEKGYSKDNCRWATLIQQARNKRDTVFITYKGETKSLSDWAEFKGVKRGTMYMRKRRGYTVDEIINGKS